jgi:aqualysin 1
MGAAMLLACTEVVLAQTSSPTLAPLKAAGKDAVPDRYIVVLKDDLVQAASENVAGEQAQRLGLEVTQTYQHALNGYAARIPAERLDDVRADNRVAYIEPDKVVKITKERRKHSKRASSAQVLPWGINRIDADVSSTKAGNHAGSVPNVNAYIIDTGIGAHSDLNVVQRINFAGGTNTDCNGHGTHVAGTVAAKDNTSAVVGVAPGAPLTGVKVLDCTGTGTWSNVIKGVDWVTANAKKPAIANMSLGGEVGEVMDSVDTAVRRSAASGVFYSVAAGNQGANACNVSPARAGAGTNNGIVTTAATNKLNQEAGFSNFGSCVDVWAPGVNVLSTKLGGGTTTLSGTSMASPHAGGTGALYLSRHPGASAAAVEAQLKANSILRGTKSKNNAPIKLVYAGRF